MHCKGNPQKIEATNKSEIVFSNYVTDTGFISRIYKEFKKLNKIIQLINAKDMNRPFSKDTNGQHIHKTCSILIVLREM